MWVYDICPNCPNETAQVTRLRAERGRTIVTHAGDDGCGHVWTYAYPWIVRCDENEAEFFFHPIV